MSCLSLHAPDADFFVPDGQPIPDALSTVTHLCIGAHHDDLEFMALSAIEHCRKNPEFRFGGIVCTDGRGSARAGAMAGTTEDDLARTRILEQHEAARIGEYAVVVQLGYPSTAVKNPSTRQPLVSDLGALLNATRPGQLLVHNFADKHPTHIAVAMASLLAVRSLALNERPHTLLGCEGWRELGWMPDKKKVLLDAGSDTSFAESLYAVFRSQIEGGKRYDRAVLGRKFANATMFNPHSADAFEMAEIAVDLTPLLKDDTLNPAEFTLALVEEFREEVGSALSTAMAFPC